jgi:uncharacterized protein (DUF58 family)
MSSFTQRVWSRWVRRRAFAVNPRRFDAGNLYILPSAFGWAFGLVLLTLFLCAINYQVSSIFFFTFLLAVAGMVSAWEAHFNLKGMLVTCLSIDDACLNESIKIVLEISLEKKSCYSLSYFFRDQTAIKIEKISPEGMQITLWLTAKQRGAHQLPRITFCSDYPLGLFRVWGYVYLDTSYYVYPMSVSPGFWPNSWIDTGNKSSQIIGNEELYELKPVVNPWTQSGRIAWKIAARGQGWYLKTMVSPEGNCWLFRIEDLPNSHLENNLQHLCYWLCEAERKGYAYGLELKGVRTVFSTGPGHLTQCLRQLAMY